MLVFVLNQMWDGPFTSTVYIIFKYHSKKKKKDRPTDPPDFCHERANKQFFFLGLKGYIVMFCYLFVYDDISRIYYMLRGMKVHGYEKDRV